MRRRPSSLPSMASLPGDCQRLTVSGWSGSRSTASWHVEPYWRPDAAYLLAMATILVTGGSGTLGQHVVSRLRQLGQDIRVLSRRAGVGTHQGDLSTGSGLAAATRGASVVVHAASDTRRFGRRDEAQTRHLLANCGGVDHFVYISIVGIDRIPYAYYRAKLRCEELIASSGVPYSILRATQFHELLELGLQVLSRLPVAPLPLDFRFQPLAAAEAAEQLATLATSSPAGRSPDVGGPEVIDLATIVGVWAQLRGGLRRTIRLPVPGPTARGFRQGLNTCPTRAVGAITWRQFLAAEPSGGAR
jgi:uncharacterized protein YbjT (DUF2867 family)